MNQILVNYNNLYHYYNIELLNLKVLEEEKEKIKSKYFKTTSSYNDKINISNEYDSKYDNFMIEMEEKDILNKIQKQKNIVNGLNYYIKKIDYHLSKLDGIEYRLFYKIINGVNISKAVEEIVEENTINNDKIQDESIIWKKYYPNIKEEIKQLNNIKKGVKFLYGK